MIYTANSLMWRIEAFGTLTEGPSHGEMPSTAVSVPLFILVLPSQMWVIEGKRIIVHKLIMYTENLLSPLDPGCLELFIESPLTASLWCTPLLLLSHSLSSAAQKWRLLFFSSQFSPMAAFLSLFYFLFPSDSSCPLHQLLEALVISNGIICLHNSDKCGRSHKDTVLCSYLN